MTNYDCRRCGLHRTDETHYCEGCGLYHWRDDCTDFYFNHESNWCNCQSTQQQEDRK